MLMSRAKLKAAPAMNIIEALDDPQLFGRSFAGPSWACWRAVLKAAFCLPMDAAELTLFRSVAERDPPTKRVSEMWVIAGRRAGKDSIASAICGWYSAFPDYADLRPGEAATVLCLAVDRMQAKIVLKYTKAYFSGIDMLKALVERETADGLELANGAELTVLASNFRSVRGRAIACAVLDECAFWRDENSASPDIETYTALVPGMATIPGSMLIGISTPHRRAGLLYQKFRDHYGQNDDDVLVIRAPSRVLNPLLPEKIVQDALARDPAAARSEWLAEWRDDVGAFISRDLIEAAVDRDVVVRAPAPGVRYVGFCDPSGGLADSFTAAIAHPEGDSVILDCLLEFPAPFNPSGVTADIAKTLNAYGLNSVVGDRYAGSWTVAAFEKHNIRYEHSERDRSTIYADCLPLFTSARARILDSKRLVTQFCNLERRATTGGKDKIDHPAQAHDDLCNSAAGALVLAAQKPKFDSSYSWVCDDADISGPPTGRPLYLHPYFNRGW
jgi:hypothetical protein